LLLTSLTVEGAEVFGGDIVKFLEEIARVGNVLVLGVSLLYDVGVLCGHRGVDLNVALAEVFDANGVEGKGLDRGIRSLVSLGEERDERRDVFLELREVKGYVVLVELDILVVDLRRGDSELEFRVLESGDHRLDVLLNLNHLVLDLLNLSILGGGVVLDVSDLLSELLLEPALLFLGKLAELFVSLDLGFNVFVELSNDINLRVEVVDVVNKRVVLLLRFAEGCYNFFVGADAGLLLDLLEGILNNFDVSNVHVHEVLLLLVVGDPFG